MAMLLQTMTRHTVWWSRCQSRIYRKPFYHVLI